MKKRFKNILSKRRKKNGVVLLICAITLAVSLGTLAGCSIVTENTEEIKVKDIPEENIQPDEPSSQSTDGSPEEEMAINDYSVLIENLTIALYENKQDITDKLNEAGIAYNEYDFNLTYSDSVYDKYDSYYMIGESPIGTDESLWVDASLCVYFEDDICVRLSFLKEEVQTVRGIRLGDSYSKLIEQYGGAFEKHTYAAHGVYDVYLYSFDDHICEFTILKDHPDSICVLDLYLPSLYPVYENGEELTDS